MASDFWEVDAWADDIVGASPGQSNGSNSSMALVIDHSDWATFVSQDWQALANAPAEIRADPDVICKAMRDSGGRALEHASDELRSDREFLLGAAQEMGPAVLAHASQQLRTDRDFILEVAEFCSPGEVLWHVPTAVRDELLADRDFVLEAVQQIGAEALEEASVALKGDRSFIEAAAEFCLGFGEVLQYATEQVRQDFFSDREFMLKAVKEGGAEALEDASEELRRDRAFILAAAKVCHGGLDEVLPYASGVLRASLVAPTTKTLVGAESSRATGGHAPMVAMDPNSMDFAARRPAGAVNDVAHVAQSAKGPPPPPGSSLLFHPPSQALKVAPPQDSHVSMFPSSSIAPPPSPAVSPGCCPCMGGVVPCWPQIIVADESMPSPAVPSVLDPLTRPPVPSSPSQPVVFIEKKIGARVRRGPDWVWENQDGHEGNIGTTENHSQDNWVQVRWDGTGDCGVYRVGLDGAFDLYEVPEAEDPRIHIGVMRSNPVPSFTPGAPMQDVGSEHGATLPPWRRRENGNLLRPGLSLGGEPAQIGLHPALPTVLEVQTDRSGDDVSDPRKRSASVALPETDAPAPWQKHRRRRATAAKSRPVSSIASGGVAAIASDNLPRAETVERRAAAQSSGVIEVMEIVDTDPRDGGPFDIVQDHALGAEIVEVFEDAEEQQDEADGSATEDEAPPAERSAAELALEELCARGAAAFDTVSSELRADREFMLAASRICPLREVLKHVSHALHAELHADREFVLRCVEELGPHVLEQAALALRADLGFMMEASACSSAAEAMKYAADELKQELEDDGE
eukprot:CAMPEP_0170237916 /NCGR_PEP_ID=MMETSP0116_2-20130129/18712_1 /TAXON_ID=400756 /ORGANISM="Durinskia baltica, Strain CSIRO CS-38" /LENGTH=801 /DNA_ID=CAMNT_0010488727 /DNA_START=26 /DNA_END=2431 /DNA_ORIENTATION=-